MEICFSQSDNCVDIIKANLSEIGWMWAELNSRACDIASFAFYSFTDVTVLAELNYCQMRKKDFCTILLDEAQICSYRVIHSKPIVSQAKN
jgi:hypothetical protein